MTIASYALIVRIVIDSTVQAKHFYSLAGMEKVVGGAYYASNKA